MKIGYAASLVAVFISASAAHSTEVDPQIYQPYTKSAYPKTFAKWGAKGIKKIDRYRKAAAITAAASPKCDKVELSELSENRSSPPNGIVILVDCANGERFYLTSSDIEGGKSAQSLAEKTSTLDEAALIDLCDAATRKVLKYPSTYSRTWGQPKVYRAPQGNVVVTIEFTAKNDLGAELPQQARCVTDDRGSHPPEISGR